MNAESTESAENVKLPGLPLALFAVAVDRFVELRDSGRISLFVGRENSVRVLGDVKDYTAIPLEPDAGKKSAAEGLEEIRQLVEALLSYGSPEQAAEYLSGMEHRRIQGDVPDVPERQVASKSHYLAKARLCQERLELKVLEVRSQRIATTRGAVLEDMDMEIISERRSQLEDRVIDEPFLRLRLRYTEPNGMPFRFSFFGNANSKQFEIECDESDIDLLIARLVQAKALLARVINRKTAASDAVTVESKT